MGAVVWLKMPQMPPKIFDSICLPKPKFGIFEKKRSLWMSAVRGFRLSPSSDVFYNWFGKFWRIVGNFPCLTPLDEACCFSGQNAVFSTTKLWKDKLKTNKVKCSKMKKSKDNTFLRIRLLNFSNCNFVRRWDGYGILKMQIHLVPSVGILQEFLNQMALCIVYLTYTWYMMSIHRQCLMST